MLTVETLLNIVYTEAIEMAAIDWTSKTCPNCKDRALATTAGGTERCDCCGGAFRRVAQMLFSPFIFMNMASGLFRVADHGLPADAELVNANYLPERGAFMITVWSSEFEPTQIGQVIPVISGPFIEPIEFEVDKSGEGTVIVEDAGDDALVCFNVCLPLNLLAGAADKETEVEAAAVVGDAVGLFVRKFAPERLLPIIRERKEN